MSSASVAIALDASGTSLALTTQVCLHKNIHPVKNFSTIFLKTRQSCKRLLFRYEFWNKYLQTYIPCCFERYQFLMVVKCDGLDVLALSPRSTRHLLSTPVVQFKSGGRKFQNQTTSPLPPSWGSVELSRLLVPQLDLSHVFGGLQQLLFHLCPDFRYID